MKRVLVFLDNFDTGGVTSVVKTIYRNINSKEYSMDFVRRNCNVNEFDAEIKKDGNMIYYYEDCGLNSIPVINYKRRQLHIAKQVLKQIKRGKIEYDAIHVHANPIIGLFIGKKLNIPVRIMHTHEAIPDFGDNIHTSKIMNFIWKQRRQKYNTWTTIKAGDSKKACIAKYGEEVVYDPKMEILYPPIDMKKFDKTNYDLEETKKIFNVDSQCFNMIHVGRLNRVKNQKFLIDVLEKIQDLKKSHLYIIGDGELKDELISYADVKGVSKMMTILPGNTTPALYQLMDCSLLPSFSEAFGMVAVESQLMGVPCFVSTNVPEDVDIGMCEFLDLTCGVEYWIKHILGYDYSNCRINDALKKKFEVEELVTKMSDLYGNK